MNTKPTKSTERRIEQARAILAAGGKWISALRNDFRGREKQMYWMVDANGCKVAGLGFATLNDMRKAGMLRSLDCHWGSTCHQEWALNDTIAA